MHVNAISNSSFAALGVLFAEQTYTVTEGDTVNITLNLTSSYEFNFTVTLQYMNGSAVGESICGREVEPLIQGIIYTCAQRILSLFIIIFLLFGVWASLQGVLCSNGFHENLYFFCLFSSLFSSF